MPLRHDHGITGRTTCNLSPYTSTSASKGFSSSRTRRQWHSTPFQANGSTCQHSHWPTSAPDSASYTLHSPASQHRPLGASPLILQSRRGNSQPSHARPKGTTQGSQPGRPTRAYALTWDRGGIGRKGWLHNPVGRQRAALPDRPSTTTPGRTLSHAR